MVNINLLPWRDHLRQREQKILKIALLISISLSCVFIISRAAFFYYQHHHLTAGIAKLKNGLQEQINLQTLMGKQDQGNQNNEGRCELDSYRETTPVLLRAFSQPGVANVCLQTLTRNTKRVVITGLAASIPALMHYLHQKSLTEIFTAINITALSYDSHQMLQFQADAIEKTQVKARHGEL